MPRSEWRPRLRWATELPGLLPAGVTRHSGQQPFSLVAPFLRLALLLSLSAGFGLGAALAMGEALAWPRGVWWPAMVQIHGRAQLVGFVGLFILATGLHFLPRLRGAPLASPVLARWGLVAVSAGSAGQAIFQTVAVTAPPVAAPAVVAVASAAASTWLGATLVIVALVRTVRDGPPLGWRGGLTSILPFLGFGFAAVWLALLINSVSWVRVVVTAGSAVPAVAESLVVDLLLFGFTLSLAFGISARLLPIFLGIEVVTVGPLLAVFLVHVVGTSLRVVGDVSGQSLATGIGDVCLGLSCAGFPICSRVPFGRRRDRRSADPPALVRTSRAPNLLIRSAYGWLALGGLVLVVDGVARLVSAPFVLPEDGWRHILTVGYLTMLIMGVGARLLPGFARTPPQASRRLLVVVVFANFAAFLRAMPLLADAFGGNGAIHNVAFGVSGPCALIAVGLFTWYVWPMLRG